MPRSRTRAGFPAINLKPRARPNATLKPNPNQSKVLGWCGLVRC